MSEESNGLTKSARRFTIMGAAFIMFITLVSLVWAGFRKAEVYVSLPQRLDRVEVKVDRIDKNVETLIQRRP